MESFESLGLNSNLLAALSEMSWTSPTEVQAMTIPKIMKGRDVFVRAKTGTGKTAAFLLPIMQVMVPNRRPQALVILPTRELALQIDGVAKKLGRSSRITTTTVYGGVSLRPQIESLRHGVDIVVGTPGRIIDLMERGNINFDSIRFLVLDEADLMLDMGFIEDIGLIMRRLPEHRQTLLFSATTRPEILMIADRYMKDPAHISVGGEEQIVVTTIKHNYIVVDRFKKFATLLAFMRQEKSGRSIIFARTQATASLLYEILKDQHMNPILLHGGMTQARREYAMRNFRGERRGILIATNVAARGLDIPDVNDVINFDAPDDPTVYVHRVGRSARMGKDGKAFTIFSAGEDNLIRDIEAYSGVKMERIHVDSEQFRKVDFGKYMRRGSYRGQERRGTGFMASHEKDRKQFGRGGFRSRRRMFTPTGPR